MKKHSIFRSVIFLLLFTVSVFAKALTTTQYTLIIDAGSTGSRLHLFQYKTGGEIPEVQSLFSEKVKPGLSSFESNPQAAGASLKKPLDDVLLELKKQQIDPKVVTLSIFGTAGMRLLPVEKQDAIYNNVSLFLEKNYPFPQNTIDTLPGNLEGLFGWLTVNYLLKNFTSSLDLTQGSIDVGGASTQVVFSTLDTSRPENLFKLKIGQQSYLVYSKSFLRLGLREALLQINTDPLAKTCYPAHYPLSTKETGDFNFATCSNLYANLINQYKVQQQLPSLANKHFVAYSGAYYTEKFFDTDKTPSKELLVSLIKTRCSKTWEELLAAYPAESTEHLASYCANGVYLSQLFYEGYQLHENQLTVANQINQQDLDWTLGGLLYTLIAKQL